MVVVEGAGARPVSRRSTMAIGIVLSVFGLGFFCWLLFTLAVYALPFLAGLTCRPRCLSQWRGPHRGTRRRFPRRRDDLGARTDCLRHRPHAVDPPLHRADLCRAGSRRRLSAIASRLPASACLPEVGSTAFAVAGAIVVGATAFARMALVYPAVGRAGLRGGHGSVSRRLAAARPDRV